ncbi:MFS transporter [Ktedonobacter sp. SOSP1-85]|uniref:MFS transporter n=1 Tax=Ktedonobacter sp. SOSP1-85 TaxID=2778367 RepID=UPI001915E3CC|nr:MFS transporter [Ktedonobacter sp. SOSP1-85]GHO78303.1 MFS transporter [Ktedonobacter sp. SOSP1-85]
MKDIATSITLSQENQQRLRQARIAVIVLFFINGTLLATWATRIPDIQARITLSAGRLGIALLGASLGGLIAMNIAGRVSASIGSKTITVLAALCLCIVLPLLALEPSLPLLMLNLVFCGASNGAMDVTMNMQGASVEQAYGKPIFNSFHACYSAGSLFGAFVGGFVASQGLSPLLHFLIVATIGAISVLAITRWLLSTPPVQENRQPEAVTRREKSVWKFRLTLPSHILLLLGILAFCALLSEGAMGNWSVVYLTEIVHSGAGLAATGYAVFSLFMAFGRFTGDYMAMRLGPGVLVRIAALFAGIGLGLGVIVPWTPTVLLGFAFIGLGLSIIFPLILSAASRVSQQSTGATLAAVTTCGYCGLLIGPPIIGFVSDRFGLQIGLAMVVFLCFVIALFAPVTNVPQQPT